MPIETRTINASRIWFITDTHLFYTVSAYIERLNKIVEIKSSWTYDKNGTDQELKKINERKKIV